MKIYVVDTSYMLELLKVPNHSEENSVKEVRSRFKEAFENKFRLYVPLPCIFETGNHIANVSNGDIKRKLVLHLQSMIESSISEGNPFIITPATSLEDFLPLFKEFAVNFSLLDISLTDSFVIQEAVRFKKEHGSKGYAVHIWTRDQSLKSYEPDKEENPFV